MTGQIRKQMVKPSSKDLRSAGGPCEQHVGPGKLLECSSSGAFRCNGRFQHFRFSALQDVAPNCTTLHQVAVISSADKVPIAPDSSPTGFGLLPIAPGTSSGKPDLSEPAGTYWQLSGAKLIFLLRSASQTGQQTVKTRFTALPANLQVANAVQVAKLPGTTWNCAICVISWPRREA